VRSPSAQGSGAERPWLLARVAPTRIAAENNVMWTKIIGWARGWTKRRAWLANPDAWIDGLMREHDALASSIDRGTSRVRIDPEELATRPGLRNTLCDGSSQFTIARAMDGVGRRSPTLRLSGCVMREGHVGIHQGS